jgi:hypothetical protein
MISREIAVTVIVEVEFDESLIPDDEWRGRFYPINTASDLARHFAHNHVMNRIDNLNQMDGFADRDNDQLDFVDVSLHETELIGSYDE